MQQYRSRHVLTFCFKREIALCAVIGTNIRVRADMFAQHAWLLTADPTLLTDVFTPSTPPYIHIVLIGFVTIKRK